MAMQHWNNDFNESHNYQRIHGNENERYHQADFNSNDRFNMPHRYENYGNPDYRNNNENMYQQRGYNMQPNQQHFNNNKQNHEQNMRLHSGRHTEQEWDILGNGAENVPDDNYRTQDKRKFNDNRMRNENRGYNNENNRLNTPNYGNSYNPQNRNYDPYFADDEGGFSGGYISQDDDIHAGYLRNFGFDNGNNFYNRHPQLRGESRSMRHNQHEGQNRWHQDFNNNSRENNGGHFGH
jgi:hypothetical protein